MNSTMYKRIIYPGPSEIYSRHTRLIQYFKSINVYQQTEEKNHMTILVNTRKILTKIHLVMITTLIKNIYRKPRANIILNAFLLKTGTKQMCLLLSLIFNIVLEVLISTRQEK